MSTFPSWDQHAHWVRVYRARIKAGQETCRVCGCANEWATAQQLTLDHIFPRSLGGTSQMENATILCVECNNKKGSGPAKYRTSLAAEEAKLRPRERPSRRPVPEVPPGPWDAIGASRQAPRSPRGRRKAVAKELPEWARPLYLDFEKGQGEVPDWVRSLILSKYSDAYDGVPPYVLSLLGESAG